MKITVNGNETILDKELNVREALSILDVGYTEYVTVQLNDEILTKDVFESTVIKDGDRIEFLYFMGGGSR